MSTVEERDSLGVSAPRFLVEIVAWVATPWALASYSIWLAILSVVVLIGLPTVFGMPGSKKQTVPVPIPGKAAIALELLQPVAACIAAFVVWPVYVAVGVVALSMVACALQFRRWQWMFGA